MKRESWNIGKSLKNRPTHPNQITLEELAQGSLRRVYSREVGFFLVKLA